MDENSNLKISKVPIKNLNEELKILVSNAKKEEEFKGKLLE